MRKGTIRKLSDKMVQIFYDYPKRENNYPKVFPASNSLARDNNPLALIRQSGQISNPAARLNEILANVDIR